MTLFIHTQFFFHSRDKTRQTWLKRASLGIIKCGRDAGDEFSFLAFLLFAFMIFIMTMNEPFYSHTILFFNHETRQDKHDTELHV